MRFGLTSLLTTNTNLKIVQHLTGTHLSFRWFFSFFLNFSMKKTGYKLVDRRRNDYSKINEIMTRKQI